MMGSDARSDVADFLAEAVRRDPGRPAVVSPERAWSYAELDRAVDRRAAELERDGLAAGVVHPVTLEADARGVVSLLALWRLGATPAPLNPRLTEVERRHAVEALGGAAPGAQAILWTSGTSGRPRGVALSADNLRASARAAATRLGLGPDDVWLASLSVAHVGGIALVTRSLLLGGVLAAWGRFTAASASALLDGVVASDGATVRLTHLSVVPTQLLHLLEERGGAPPPWTLRCALVGGAHAPSDLVARALREGWPLALTYGMTETTSQVATAPPGLVRAKPGTVGRPLDGTELRLSADGEILVRGATLPMGYVGTDTPLRDEQGWYHTGDLGRLDGEGDLWITGRRSDRIVSGGVNVDAHEVEAALRAHPAVRDACVVGLPDERWGEVVGAALVWAGGPVDVDALAEWVRERVSAAKRPRRWLVMAALPLNANGKVDRGAVRRELLGG
ncbi:MAG TPA: AMP-binding protein [Longimicrobiales bacterium]|nr:AMP-binding protein [Longimicrobiales bacterium]